MIAGLHTPAASGETGAAAVLAIADFSFEAGDARKHSELPDIAPGGSL